MQDITTLKTNTYNDAWNLHHEVIANILKYYKLS